ncbi:MAG: choline dehydrogenase [Deltaproteobacteria bacterium]
MNKKNYDFIIVGGGSAGCALANRLSADPANQVLVLEAGRPDYPWDLFIHMPAGLSFPIGNRFYDWKYESEPEPGMGGRRIYHARGKVLGGSSSINGMIYIRGNALGYERWAAEEGMADWNYAGCLPYFRRAEHLLEGDREFHGTNGPLHLERGPCTNPLFGAFLESARQAGYPATEDINGFQQEGFAPFDRNVRNGRRLSAARAYLHPVKHRPNLTVICRAQTTRILLEGNRAVGVEVRRGRRREIYRAGTIISASGAIGSPQLLQLSGIGPADHLRSVGVPVHTDLPGVGANLQDHLEVYIQHACTQPVSEQPALQWYNKPWIGLQWLLGKRGPAATNHFEAGGFVRSNAEAEYPNVQFHFLPLAIRYDGSAPESGHGYQVHVGPVLSDARGWVKIRSTDARDKPAMLFNYLSTEQDQREWVESIRCARDILSQPALAPFDGGEVSPGAAVETDAEILAWVRRDAETALHPSCTCKMGTDAEAVIDPSTMQVHGVKGLAVVDASVMPQVTNGNIYAPTMMIAERAADLLLGNQTLAPENTPFFRAEASIPSTVAAS